MSDAEIDRLSRCLVPDERHRASKFRFERDRRRFLAARGILRHILAEYLGVDPGQLGFRYGPQGKPFLGHHADVQFNVSHAGEALLVGVARDRRLGIDIEPTIAEAVVHEVIGAVSSGPERSLLLGLDSATRQECFTRLWTRKEAYIKADGRGMALDLKQIDVLSVPGQLQMIGERSLAWEPCRSWILRDLDVGPGLAAALVAEGPDWRVARFDWPAGTR